MDPETQRLFVISLVGLLLFFPVFNQVAATALDNLRDADHKAKFDDFLKNWDDIPEDRKLEYWDGRNPPPEHWEGGEPPDDFTYGGNGNGGGPGNNGNGGDDENETEEEEEEETIVYETVILWKFPGEGQNINGGYQGGDDLRPRHDYHYVNVSSFYEQFTGNAEFTLLVGEEAEWDLVIGDGNTPAILEDQDPPREDTIQDVGTAPLTMEYEYDPKGFPGDFNITVTGTYPVSRG